MSIPIVKSLAEAPEKGDAVLQILNAQFLEGIAFVPVRDQAILWFCNSIHGWQTTAKEIAEGSPKFAEDMLVAGKHCLSGYTFAPDAETAVKRFNEKQPFGEIILTHYSIEDGGTLAFSQRAGDYLVYFSATVCEIEYFGDYNSASLVALHALLGEVITYQRSCAAGTEGSRIHAALKGIKL